jgi:hypothetical protein
MLYKYDPVAGTGNVKADAGKLGILFHRLVGESQKDYEQP